MKLTMSIFKIFEFLGIKSLIIDLFTYFFKNSTKNIIC